MTMPGRMISNALENDSYAISFIHLELRRGERTLTERREKARQGLDYRTVDKIMYFLEGGFNFKKSGKEAFQRCINLDAQKHQTRLVEGKDKPFTKAVICLGHGTHQDLPS